jgi:two-component system chemotaxis sensor kinase CheA
MADTHQDGAGSGADFDLSQFYQIFFEEASENLDQMEQMLLSLDLSAANDEELNGIFRCAHSIKGGAATFGFSDVTELTHRMESLLDRCAAMKSRPSPRWSMCCWSRRTPAAACWHVTSPATRASRFPLLNWWCVRGPGPGPDRNPQVNRSAAAAEPVQPAAAVAAVVADTPAQAPAQAAEPGPVIGTEPPEGRAS